MLGASQCGHLVTIEAPHVMQVKYVLYASCCKRITPRLHFGHSFFDNNIGDAPFSALQRFAGDAAYLKEFAEPESISKDAFVTKSQGIRDCEHRENPRRIKAEMRRQCR